VCELIDVLEQLGRFGVLREVLHGLDAPTPAVRLRAARAWLRLDEHEAAARLVAPLRNGGRHELAAESVHLVARAMQGRTDEAIANYERAVELYPLYGKAHANLAELLARLGRTEEAIEHYEAAVEVHPDFLPAITNLATSSSRSDRPAAVVAPLSASAPSVRIERA